MDTQLTRNAPFSHAAPGNDPERRLPLCSVTVAPRLGPIRESSVTVRRIRWHRSPYSPGPWLDGREARRPLTRGRCRDHAARYAPPAMDPPRLAASRSRRWSSALSSSSAGPRPWHSTSPERARHAPTYLPDGSPVWVIGHQDGSVRRLLGHLDPCGVRPRKAHLVVPEVTLAGGSVPRVDLERVRRQDLRAGTVRPDPMDRHRPGREGAARRREDRHPAAPPSGWASRAPRPTT